MTDSLENWLHQAKQNGLSEEQITTSLKQIGWSDNDIQAALMQYRIQSLPPVPKAPRKMIKTWMLLGIIIVIVIGLGVGAYFLFFQNKGSKGESFSVQGNVNASASGKKGKAMTVDTNTLATFDFTDGKGFDSSVGTIELWVKPVDWNTDSAGYWEILNITDTSKNDVFEFRRGKDSIHDNLQFVAYSDGRFLGWVTDPSMKLSWKDGNWYHLAVTWSETQKPTFYINGKSYPSYPAYGETTWLPGVVTSGTITLGQRLSQFPDSSSVGFHNSARASFDELRISDIVRTETEILSDYNEGRGVTLKEDASTLFLSHFNG